MTCPARQHGQSNLASPELAFRLVNPKHAARRRRAAGAPWFFRGLAREASEAGLPACRIATFLCGIAAISAVLQTHFDYMAQHMFFLNRVQHVVMHHLGPFLIAISGAGSTLRRGMPDAARRVIGARPVTTVMGVVQQPAIAVLLFVGLFYLWLVPAIHFRAMLDPDGSGAARGAGAAILRRN